MGGDFPAQDDAFSGIKLGVISPDGDQVYPETFSSVNFTCSEASYQTHYTGDLQMDLNENLLLEGCNMGVNNPLIKLRLIENNLLIPSNSDDFFGLSIFPNPNSGKDFTINTETEGICSVYDQNGRQVHSIKLNVGNNIVNLNSLCNGLYLFSFYDKKVKVLIQK